MKVYIVLTKVNDHDEDWFVDAAYDTLQKAEEHIREDVKEYGAEFVRRIHVAIVK